MSFAKFHAEMANRLRTGFVEGKLFCSDDLEDFMRVIAKQILGIKPSF